jgi:hypothetical protein
MACIAGSDCVCVRSMITPALAASTTHFPRAPVRGTGRPPNQERAALSTLCAVQEARGQGCVVANIKMCICL